MVERRAVWALYSRVLTNAHVGGSNPSSGAFFGYYMICKWKSCEKKLVGKQQRFCSRSCNQKYNVDARRKKLKRMSIEYLGGECSACGYDRCTAALEFHHISGIKEFGISEKGRTRSWQKLKIELDKCILLCANCHRELHNKEHKEKYTDAPSPSIPIIFFGEK